MKRIKKLIISAMLALATLPLAASAAINVNYEDFSTSEATNWKLDNSLASIEDGMMVILPGSTVYQQWKMAKPFPSGTIAVEYDFKVEGERASIFIQNPNGGSICRLTVNYTTQLNLQHSSDDGTSNPTTNLTKKFESGKWYHARHIIRCTNAEGEKADSDVYIYDMNGELLWSALNKVYMDAAKYGSPKELQGIFFQNPGKTATDRAYFDNLMVYEVSTESVLAANKLSCSIPGADAVSSDIALPAKGYGDATISWKSSNPDIITDDGKVTLSDVVTNVDMTATITYNGEIETVIVPVTVLSKEAHKVTADIYNFNFDDNEVFTGLKLNTTPGYVGVRNNRLEMEKTADFEGTAHPQAVLELNKMQYGDMTGEVIVEFDFVSTADAAAICYIQTVPDAGSVVRMAQRNTNFLRVTTGGNGETAVNTNVDMAFVPGKEYHAKILINYDTNKCSVYINGTPVVENHHFMFPAPGFLRGILCQHNGTKGAVAIDNLVVYNSDVDSSIIATEAMLDKLDLENLQITEDIDLPTNGLNGAAIAWTSGYEELLTSDGKLLETPMFEMEFELTATITKNGYKLTKPYTVKVPVIEAPEKATVYDAVITNDFYGAVSTLKQGLPAVAKMNVTKPANSELSLSLIAAVYDASGVLKGVKWTDKELNAKRVTDSLSIDITDTKDADDYVILYAWDSISGMTPFNEEQRVEIE